MTIGPTQIVEGLITAAFLGGLIGLQRQISRKPAGIRTHILVSLGACAFTEAGQLFGSDRIPSTILTGIGFLGAGAIIRQGLTPHGLTTAASIWAVAAIGLACGMTRGPAYIIAAAATLIAFAALATPDWPFERMLTLWRKLQITVTLDASKTDVATILQELSTHAASAHTTDSVAFECAEDRMLVRAGIALVLSTRVRVLDVLQGVALIEGVRCVEVTDEVASG